MFNEKYNCMATFKLAIIYVLPYIKHFNLKFLSYFEPTYYGTTRPETPIYFHGISHSNFAVFEYDMYNVGFLGVCGNISCKGYLKLQ